MIKDSDLLSVKEFAEKLRVHPNTVRRGLKSGRIAGLRTGTGKRSTWRIPYSEIARMAAEDWRESLFHLYGKQKEE